MKEYIGNLISHVVFILAGLMFAYEAFQPNPTFIPMVIVFWGAVGIVGIFAVLYGLYGLAINSRDIFRHFKKKKTA